MSDELKPCPFCGGKALYMEADYQDSRHKIICNSHSECPVRPVVSASARRHVITDWNNRPVEQAIYDRLMGIPWASLVRLAEIAENSIFEDSQPHDWETLQTIKTWLAANAPEESDNG